ncbi:MAG: hypothetical protein ACOX6Z_02180 [Dethiobacteria bacterium]|jgi:NADH:ubiquinone oxidoreductase subunit 3 (subunit A)
MTGLIYSPPVVFLLFLILFLVGSAYFSLYSHQNLQREHGLDAYACGERDVQNYINPNYSQFFPYAFFFTIMHVLVLVVATASYEAPFLPVVYLASGILAMVIIFKNW